MISEDIVKEIAGRDTPTGEMTVEACIATELLELRADAETSQNHNAGVIDRIVEQLRDAGYHGTLSEMVDDVLETPDTRQELDNLKTVLHGNQDADYDKQLQIETLKAQLAEAEADADRLAKELHDWLVFAEANDQIYAARSGMNAMLHHQKRKEGK